MISDHIAQHLIAKKLTGEISEAETAELNTWLQASPEHQKLAGDQEKIWNRAEAEQLWVDTASAWKNVDRKTRPVMLRLTTSPMMRIAAVLLMVALGGFFWYTSLNPAMNQVETAANEIKRVDLPDGSVVWLHAFSHLEYEKGLTGSNREIKLEGLAFFDVKRDEAHPFRISTTHGAVQVLGTSFEVRAFKQESFERVVVATGKVRFEHERGNKLELTANMQGTLDLQGVGKTETVDALSLTAWKNSELSFDNETMAVATKKIERYFNVHIHFENDAIQACHFTGNFRAPKLTQVLDALGSALQLKIERRNDHIYLKGKGCKN